MAGKKLTAGDKLDTFGEKEKPNREKVRELLDELREMANSCQEFIDSLDELEAAVDAVDEQVEGERYEGKGDDTATLYEELAGVCVHVAECWHAVAEEVTGAAKAIEQE